MNLAGKETTFYGAIRIHVTPSAAVLLLLKP